MSSLEERVAVLEANQQRTQKDLGELFSLIRDHMEKEEKRWEEIHATLTKAKGFIGGVIFVVSSVWGVVIVGFKYLPQLFK